MFLQKKMFLPPAICSKLIKEAGLVFLLTIPISLGILLLSPRHDGVISTSSSSPQGEAPRYFMAATFQKYKSQRGKVSLGVFGICNQCPQLVKDADGGHTRNYFFTMIYFEREISSACRSQSEVKAFLLVLRTSFREQTL